jgi:hypothetical protein
MHEPGQATSDAILGFQSEGAVWHGERYSPTAPCAAGFAPTGVAAGFSPPEYLLSALADRGQSFRLRFLSHPRKFAHVLERLFQRLLDERSLLFDGFRGVIPRPHFCADA